MLDKYPAIIADLEKAGLVLKEQHQTVKAEMDAIKQAFISAINSEKTDGKKSFPNAEAREIELNNRLADSPEYQTALSTSRELEVKRAENEIETSKLKSEFSVERYKTRQRTAEQSEQAALHFAKGVEIVANIISTFAPKPDQEIDWDF